MKPTSTCFVIGLVAMLVPASALPSASPSPRVALLGSSPEEIRFRAEFPAPNREEIQVGDHTYDALTWPDLPLEGTAGEPGIPTMRVRVALPPRGDVDLEVSAEPLGSMGNVRYPPMPALEEPKPAFERPDPVLARTTRVETAVPATYRVPAQASIEDVGWERGLRVATLVLRPVTWNPGTGDAAWAGALNVVVRIHRAARAPGRTRAARPDRVGQAAWKHNVLNPGDVALFRTAGVDSAPPCAGIPSLWFNASQSWVKIGITGNGIYGLTRSMLESAGVPAASIDPRTFRLYSGPLYPDLAWTNLGWDSLGLVCDGYQPGRKHVYQKPAFCSGMADTSDFREIAIWVKGEEDGSLDASDAVVFYALGPDNYRDRFGLPAGGESYFINPWSDRTVYWLTWDSTLPGPPLRMEQVSAPPVPGDQEALDTTTRLHAEENTFEDPSLYQVGLRWERWFWERLDSQSGVKRFPVILPHLVTGSTLGATMRFWGAKVPSAFDFGEASLHHVQVTVNQVNGGLLVWGGHTPHDAFTALDASVSSIPARSPTAFTFLVPQVASTDPNRLDWVHLAWIDVTYRRDLDLGGTPGEIEIEASPDRHTLDLSGLPSGPPVILDVSDFRHPRRLLNATVSGTQTQVSWDATAPGIIAVGTENTLAPPAGMAVDPRPLTWLRDTSEPLDYVIIAPQAWMSQAEILADWRRQHLYGVTDTAGVGGEPREARVRVVSVDDIMDEFAWGMWDPSALRYFLEYAYRYYGGLGDDPLSYCLFLGDTTNDPRNYGETGSKDYVPSWEDNRDDISNIRFGNVQYVSDDPLARFDDPNPCPDAITDLYLGRLPVSSAAEAQDLIQGKVIRSEATPVYGPWRTQAILVADDVCQAGLPDGLGTAHMSQMEGVAATIPPVFQQRKIYLYDYGSDCSIVTKPEAKADLIAAWSEGAWLVDYVGHGGDVVWADEHVLDLSDTPLLANDGRFPAVGSFSCSVGKFDNPVRDGLAEAHVRALHGGALVSAAATHLTSSAGNSAVNYLFLRELFAPGVTHPMPIGVALMEDKRLFPVQADKYACLGDPASRLSVPGETLQMSGPSRLDRGQQVAVRVETAGGGTRSGTLSVDARDASLIKTQPLTYKMPGAQLYRGEALVAADTALVRFTVPISLRGGPDGRIASYMWGTNWDAAQVMSPLPVGGLATAGTDTVGPAITYSLTVPEVESGQSVTVTLEDPSGINLTRLFEFRSILLKVTDRSGLEQLRQDLTESFTYDIGSHTKGTLEFRVPDLPPAPYTFSISATDNFNNRSQGTATVELGNATTALGFEGTHLAYPNPFDPAGEPTKLLFSLNRSAQVTIRVYSVSGRLVRKADFSAQAGPNAFSWNGRDEAGDAVANGVYLVRLIAQRTGSEETARILERVVVLR